MHLFSLLSLPSPATLNFLMGTTLAQVKVTTDERSYFLELGIVAVCSGLALFAICRGTRRQ